MLNSSRENPSSGYDENGLPIMSHSLIRPGKALPKAQQITLNVYHATNKSVKETSQMIRVCPSVISKLAAQGQPLTPKKKSNPSSKFAKIDSFDGVIRRIVYGLYRYADDVYPMLNMLLCHFREESDFPYNA